MSKGKNVKITNVIKSDVSYEVFNYFRTLIEMNCLEEHFTKLNLSMISILNRNMTPNSFKFLEKTLEENISDHYKNEYVVVFGKDLAYYLQ